MKASEARKIADNFYKEEVDFYLENIYSPEEAEKEIIEFAEKGNYIYTIKFLEKLEFQSKIKDRSKELIIERFINFFTDLGYKVEKSKVQHRIERSVDHRWKLDISC